MSKPGGNKFRTGEVALVSVTHMLHDIYSSFLAPLRPLLIEKFGITLALASVWDLVGRIPWFFNPLIGMLAEKTAARYFVIITPAVTAVAMSLLGVAPNFAVVAILLFVMGISSAMFHVPSPVMIKKLSGKYTGRGMSFFMLGGEMARTIGPLVITGAVTIWGLEGSWKLIPFGLLASLILFFKLRNIHIASDIGKTDKSAGYLRTLKNYFPFFMILLGIIFFRMTLKASLTAFLPTYFFNEKGETLWFANSALAVFQLAGAVGTVVSGTLSDRLGRKTTLLIISFITPGLMALFVLSTGILSFVFLLLLGFFVFAPGPVLMALVQDVSKDLPVFMNSVYMTISFVSSAIAVVFAGLIGDWLGLEKTYLISSFLALGAVPFVFMLKKKAS